MSLEFFIASKYLKAKRKEGFISLITLLSVAGVTVGVMALVIVIAVMSGAEIEFRKRILGVEPHILIMDYSGKFTNYKDVEEKLKNSSNFKGINAVSPLVFGQTLIRSASGLSGAVVRGIEPASGVSIIKGFTAEELEEKLGIDKKSDEDSERVFPKIIMGRELAKHVGVAVGDKVVLMAPGGMLSPVGQMASMTRFIVTGIFDSGMYEYDSSLAYININDAQKLMGMRGRISALGVWVKDLFQSPQIKDSIVNTLGSTFYGRDWMEINKSLFSALKLEKTAMFVILTLIILVAAFNIASTLIMMVMEKTRDIAVFKAMGATDMLIRKIFVIQGMIIGLIGTVLGTFAGVFVCILLKKYQFIELPSAYPFSTLPIQLEYLDVIVISISSIIICFLSTIYPSYKASKMDPVEALRYG
ncbi:MAG: lipoprotein-releasing ABC transporter permease subunit [Desulfamplus sp.]|nr:lipoprotein-releasing ABC transporter permease subunit [Desulfamplus sp.]